MTTIERQGRRLIVNATIFDPRFRPIDPTVPELIEKGTEPIVAALRLDGFGTTQPVKYMVEQHDGEWTLQYGPFPNEQQTLDVAQYLGAQLN